MSLEKSVLIAMPEEPLAQDEACNYAAWFPDNWRLLYASFTRRSSGS
jgi:hypothetical protein